MITSPVQAEHIVATGQADTVIIARELFAILLASGKERARCSCRFCKRLERWRLGDSTVSRVGPAVKRTGSQIIDCPRVVIVPAAKIPIGPGYQTPFAEQIRREAGILTGAVGMITSPVQAEHIVATGQADAVIIARELLRDPYWPAARRGAAVRAHFCKRLERWRLEIQRSVELPRQIKDWESISCCPSGGNVSAARPVGRGIKHHLPTNSPRGRHPNRRRGDDYLSRYRQNISSPLARPTPSSLPANCCAILLAVASRP